MYIDRNDAGRAIAAAALDCSVGEWYVSFEQVLDQDVVKILRNDPEL